MKEKGGEHGALYYLSIDPGLPGLTAGQCRPVLADEQPAQARERRCLLSSSARLAVALICSSRDFPSNEDRSLKPMIRSFEGRPTHDIDNIT